MKTLRPGLRFFSMLALVAGLAAAPQVRAMSLTDVLFKILDAAHQADSAIPSGAAVKGALPMLQNCFGVLGGHENTDACINALASAGGASASQLQDLAAIEQQCSDPDSVSCVEAIAKSNTTADLVGQILPGADVVLDIISALDPPDFWEIVSKVGVDAACVAAEFITGGINVCGVLAELAKIGGAIVDAVEDAAGAIEHFLDNLFSYDASADMGPYFENVWEASVNAVAQATIKDPSQFFALVDSGDKHALRLACYNYFEPSSMSADTANAVCNAMRDGSNACCKGAFVGKGFTQQVIRQIALLKLPEAILDKQHAVAFEQRAMDEYLEQRQKALAPFRNQGSPPPIRMPKGQKPEAWIVQAVESLYGYGSAALKTNLSAWPPGSVGLAAATKITEATSKPYAVNPPDGMVFATGHDLAVSSLTAAENDANLAKKVDDVVKAHVDTEVANAKALTGLSAALQQDIHNDPANKALANAHAECASASDPKQCNAEVDKRNAACVQKVKDFDKAHPEEFNPDAGGMGTKARGQHEQLRVSCANDILQWAKQFHPLIVAHIYDANPDKLDAACAVPADPNAQKCKAEADKRYSQCLLFEAEKAHAVDHGGGAASNDQQAQVRCLNDTMPWVTVFSRPLQPAPRELHGLCAVGSDPDPRKCNAEVDKRFVACAQRLRDFDLTHVDQKIGKSGRANPADTDRSQIQASCEKDIESWVKAFVRPAPKLHDAAPPMKSTATPPSGEARGSADSRHAPAQARNSEPAHNTHRAASSPPMNDTRRTTSNPPAHDAHKTNGSAPTHQQDNPLPLVHGCTSDPHHARQLNCVDTHALDACNAESLRHAQAHVVCHLGR